MVKIRDHLAVDLRHVYTPFLFATEMYGCPSVPVITLNQENLGQRTVEIPVLYILCCVLNTCASIKRWRFLLCQRRF